MPNRRQTDLTPNPLYVQIGKRIRTARLAAGETNSRALSLRLGWSGGRLNNFETGVSTPGVEETLVFCAAVGANPSWITYGLGPQGPATKQAARYFHVLAVLAQAERDERLDALMEATGLSRERIARIRAKPGTALSDRLIRWTEQFAGVKAGTFDRWPRDRQLQDLLTVFFTVSPEQRAVLLQDTQRLLEKERG